jgi:methyl-accepting chemotaxis protein
METVATTMRSTNQHIEHFSSTVGELHTSSMKINEIVLLINDISDQTNLLALNAAIEAARAGEFGRGFAVVADEVRKLAERTGQATEEIDGMMQEISVSKAAALSSIEQAVTRVRSGAELSNKASVSIDAIMSEAEAVKDVVRRISDSLHDQNRSAREIADRVNQVAESSQESMEAAQAGLAATQQLEEVAASLRIAADRFRTT